MSDILTKIREIGQEQIAGVDLLPQKIEKKIQFELFEEHLPTKPYCTDALESGLLIRAKKSALIKKYIQHNQPTQIRWLVYDCDYWGALEHVGQNQLPAPNLIAVNPANGHSHLFYGLSVPVCTTENGRKKPIALLAKIDYVLCEQLQADQGYVGLISKNPLKTNVWDVREVNPASYELADFLEYLELPAKLPKNGKVQGLGRNVTLFETARQWAYRAVLAYRLTAGREQFTEAVLSQCQVINLTFPAPLGFSEVKATAKSISKWTWEKYTARWTDEEFAAKQAARGKLGGTAKGIKNQEKRAQACSMRLQGLTQTAIATELGVSQKTVSNWLNHQL